MVKIKSFLGKNRLVLPAILATFTLIVAAALAQIISGEKKAVVAKRVELAEARRDLELLDGILADRKEYEEELLATRRSFPATYEEVAFFASQVERVSGRNAQELETKIDKTAKDEQSLSSLKFTLSTSGAFSGFTGLMSSLANLPYHTRVDSLKIEEAGVQVSTLLNFRLYLARQ